MIIDEAIYVNWTQAVMDAFNVSLEEAQHECYSMFGIGSWPYEDLLKVKQAVEK